MAGAKSAEQIKIIGGDGNIYVVDTWNRGTVADGIVMTDYTIRPICSAIQGGSQGLSAETERAMAAESGISAIVDAHYDEYTTFKESVIISADELDEKISGVSAESLRYDNFLSGQIDTISDQIDTLKAATDVIMVYNTYSNFSTKSGSLTLTDNDVIKVLNDEERQENQTYYQYSTATSAWSFIGELDPYYSKSDLNDAAGKNINITTANGIKINTNDNVNFDSVSATTAYGSSAKFTNISATNISANLFKSEFGTVDTYNLKFLSANGSNLTANNANVLQLTANTLYGQSNNSNVDSLIGSAQSGAEASAYITAHSADFLNSAHNAYGKLTFGTKEYPATNSSYNFTILAGQGIGFTTGNNQVTISAEGTTYQASSYISTANKKISVTGSLITSAEAGSAASAWVNNTLFDYSYNGSVDPETASGSIDKIKILYKNDVASHDIMLNQEVVFERGNYSVSGLLIQAATNNDDGKVLTYNTAYNNYTWQPTPPSTYSNDDGCISIDNLNRKIDLSTTGIKTSAYSASYNSAGNIYESYLNGQTLHFSYGHGGLDISFTGVSYYGGGSQGSTNWDNLFRNYAQVNRDSLSTANLTADKVNFIVATGSSGTQPYKVVNFVVTSTLPTTLEENTYYIV